MAHAEKKYILETVDRSGAGKKMLLKRGMTGVKFLWYSYEETILSVIKYFRIMFMQLGTE